ncbi:hypothetical protein IT570_00210 [Candidatus Sumerlaeota bacterium]|nr:hypothetical protein [Candidatus Sumerlaeota bacterium]
MPCTDVTELLRLRLDDGDRIVGYELIKRTCGRAVGERSLLAQEFVGADANEVAKLTADDFAETLPDMRDEEFVLSLKHFFAVRAGARVLIGHMSGGANDPIRVAKVGYEGNEVILEAEVVIDVITEEIKACGKCKGCGALTAKKLAAL